MNVKARRNTICAGKSVEELRGLYCAVRTLEDSGHEDAFDARRLIVAELIERIGRDATGDFEETIIMHRAALEDGDVAIAPDGREVEAYRELTHHMDAASAKRGLARAQGDAGYPAGARFFVLPAGERRCVVVMDAREAS